MRSFVLSFLLMFPAALFSQTQQPTTMATAANFYKTDQYNLSWTIGESFVESYINASLSLTQGFQQGTLEIETLLENNYLENDLTVYPNPVNDILHIKSVNGKYNYKLIDVNGSVITQGKSKNNLQELNFSAYPSGTYFLKINSANTYKIIKH